MENHMVEAKSGLRAGVLEITLMADVARLQRDMDKARSIVRKACVQMESDFKKVAAQAGKARAAAMRASPKKRGNAKR